MFRTTTRRRQAGPSGGLGMRLIIGLIVAAFALISYFMSSEYNPVTDSEQHLSLTPQQEIALGLQRPSNFLQASKSAAFDLGAVFAGWTSVIWVPSWSTLSTVHASSPRTPQIMLLAEVRVGLPSCS